MVAQNKHQPVRQSADAVMEKLGAKAPHLAEHCYTDRDWIWYCGESLQRKPADRDILKGLGFRWSKNGHLMPDGKTLGSWGHSCQKPMFSRRKKPAVPTRATAPAYDEELRDLGL